MWFLKLQGFEIMTLKAVERSSMDLSHSRVSNPNNLF
jgi:hypothetical protein